MQPRNILLIEDNPDLRNFYSIVLQSTGHSIHSESNGKDAISRISNDPFHLIITDLTMPDLSIDQYVSNLEALRLLHAFQIMIISGRDDMASWAKKLGDCKFLRKPIDIMTLTREIHSSIN